jgi:hypothetical protein
MTSYIKKSSFVDVASRWTKGSFFLGFREWMVQGHHLNNCAFLSRRRYLQFGWVRKAIPVADAKGLVKPVKEQLACQSREKIDATKYDEFTVDFCNLQVSQTSKGGKND